MTDKERLRVLRLLAENNSSRAFCEDTTRVIVVARTGERIPIPGRIFELVQQNFFCFREAKQEIEKIKLTQAEESFFKQVSDVFTR